MQDTLYNVFDTGEEIYDLEFINDHIGYAVCSDGIIAKTEDGGYSWALDTSPTEETLQAMAYFGENIWVVGQSGTILKTTVPNAVDMLDSGIPEVFTLKQNFPNPFNPTTQISFGMPRTSNVRLEIYNILGQKVRTLVSSDLNAGFHVYEWDARNDAGQRMAAGVYIYQLNTGGFVQQKKMLLLK